MSAPHDLPNEKGGAEGFQASLVGPVEDMHPIGGGEPLQGRALHEHTALLRALAKIALGGLESLTHVRGYG